ncbi:MAG: chorismate-binding protein [Dermatophilaceae bacterium]|jgi:para-aminobenzoate synthetase component 1
MGGDHDAASAGGKAGAAAYDLRVSTARFGTLWAADPVEVTHDPGDLTEGFWVVVQTFEGELTAVRMARHGHGGPTGTPTWDPLTGPWRTSLGEEAYLGGVREIRRRIAAGTVYQVNLCRILEHDLPGEASVAALGALLAVGNPAPYAATIDLPEAGLEIACASPEGFLEREGRRLVSRPIKGTAPTIEEMLPKDVAENVMIVDLVRHDLGGICTPGTVAVERLCRDEVHPGLVHLVSDVAGELRPGVEWPAILTAMAPAGSVSGAPKHTALVAIEDLETVPRGPYCGAIGWIDADRELARLAVGIRSFWATTDRDRGRVLRFGTGAGITWGSQPDQEWAETELKAHRLIGLASGRLGP